MTPSVQKRSIPLPPSLREVSCHSANADGTTEGVLLDKENCRYRKRICENKATPSAASEQGKLCQPLLRRGRALMPAPPFPTNLLLRKIFAGALKRKRSSLMEGVEEGSDHLKT